MTDIYAMNGVKINSIAYVDGIDINNSGFINGDNVLLGFYSRIKYGYIDSDLLQFPIGIELGADDFILSGLGATDWQYIHATVGGIECFVEVDIWDVVTPKVVLWIKVPSISSSIDTLIKLEKTAVKNDFITVTGGLTWDDFTGTNGDSANIDLWEYVETGGTAEIQSNKIQIDHTAIQNTSIRSRAILSGDFDIQIDFDILSGPSTNNWALQLIMTPTDTSDTDYFVAYRRYNGAHRYSSFIRISSIDYTADASTSDTTGQLRLVRSGTNVTTYYYSGGWQQIDTQSGFTTADLYIMLRGVTTSVMTLSADFDNLVINTCDSITGYIGEIGDTAGQIVWGVDHTFAYHMSQDPSAGNILDSTPNGFDGVPGGTMTTGDLIDGDFGYAIDFDGVDDNLTIANDNILNLASSDDLTIEAFFNSASNAALHSLIDKRESSGNGYVFGIRGSGGGNSLQATVDDSGSTTVTIVGDTALTQDGSVSYHGAIRVDRNTDLISVFLNGDSDATALSTASLVDCSNTNSLYIADNSITSSFTNFVGSISEFRLSKVARSDAWIKASANNLLGNLIRNP